MSKKQNQPHSDSIRSKNLSKICVPYVLDQLNISHKIFPTSAGGAIRIQLPKSPREQSKNFADYWPTTQRWLIQFDGEKIWGFRFENFLAKLIDYSDLI